MADRANISEDELLSALGIDAPASGKGSGTGGDRGSKPSAVRGSMIDDGLLIDAFLVEDPINKSITQTDAHQDSERSKARQMQLEASRDRTRAWREEVAKQKSRASATQASSRSLSEADPSEHGAHDASELAGERNAGSSASSQILEVFGPKSVNVDYGKRRLARGPEPSDVEGHGPNAAKASAAEQAQSVWGAPVSTERKPSDAVPSAKADSQRFENPSRISYDEPAVRVTARKMPANAATGLDIAGKAAFDAPNPSDSPSRATSNHMGEPSHMASQAYRATSDSMARKADGPKDTMPSSQANLAQKAARSSGAGSRTAGSLRATGSDGEPRKAASSQEGAKASEPLLEPRKSPSLERQSEASRDGEADHSKGSSHAIASSRHERPSQERSLSLMDADAPSQTVNASASLGSKKSSAYDHDFLSDIRQKVPQHADGDRRGIRGREILDEDDDELLAENRAPNSSVDPIGIALIIAAVLCVLIAVSLMTGLWDMSNVTR